MLSTRTTLNCKGRLLDISTPVVMGIINCTPDSFYSGSRMNHFNLAINLSRQMIAEGATILDIGGQSTRPDAEELDPEEELERILPVIEHVTAEFPDAILSVDTFHSSVAEIALTNGVHIINDISGGQRDEAIYKVAARFGAPYILMHRRGNAKSMQQLTDYDNIITDLIDYFSKRATLCRLAGVKDIILDPGFGFAKTIAQNWELLYRMHEFDMLGLPFLSGLSRKSMLYKAEGGTPETALSATIAANMIALQKGAKILRVHDVKEAVECIKINE